jgi:hypothetical protein
MNKAVTEGVEVGEGIRLFRNIVYFNG